MTVSVSTRSRSWRSVFVLVAAVALCLGACQDDASDAPAGKPANKSADRATVPSIAWSLPETSAVTPVRIEETEAVAAARASLESIVRTYARDPDNPWAICHAILALGTETKLTNGENAIDYLFGTYAQVKVVDGQSLVFFPLQKKRTIMDPSTGEAKTVDVFVEAHPELVLKALAERGAKPDRVVAVGGEEYTLAHLYRHCLHRSWVLGGRLGVMHWNNVAWGMRALATWAPSDLAWSADGRSMTLDGYAHQGLLNLLQVTAPQHRVMAGGKAPGEPKPGLDAYTCGGAHYVSGIGYALGRGFGQKGDREKFREVIDLVFWSYPRRLELLSRVEKKHPKMKSLVTQQRFKFIGHFIELTHKLAAIGMFEPSDAEKQLMRSSVEDLVNLVARLEKVELHKHLPAIRKRDEQRYLDYVGDSAHALHGLNLATGHVRVAH
ncbi:MAG: hypothetical protein V3T86_00895 [Planctomycetota bacterium]